MPYEVKDICIGQPFLAIAQPILDRVFVVLEDGLDLIEGGADVEVGFEPVGPERDEVAML